MILSIEIMLLAVLYNFNSSFSFDDNVGQKHLVFIILLLAGAESVIGLSILVAYIDLPLVLNDIKFIESHDILFTYVLF